MKSLLIKFIYLLLLYVSIIGCQTVDYTNATIHELAFSGSLRLLRQALPNNELVNQADSLGFRPITYAAFGNEDPEVVRMLIEAGADVNSRVAKSYAGNNWTVLMYAASNNSQEVVEILIANKAEIDAQSTNGFTALMAAAKYNNRPKVITSLLDAGANPNLTNVNMKTAFDFLKENEALSQTDAYAVLKDALNK